MNELFSLYTNETGIHKRATKRHCGDVDQYLLVLLSDCTHFLFQYIKQKKSPEVGKKWKLLKSTLRFNGFESLENGMMILKGFQRSLYASASEGIERGRVQ